MRITKCDRCQKEVEEGSDRDDFGRIRVAPRYDIDPIHHELCGSCALAYTALISDWLEAGCTEEAPDEPMHATTDMVCITCQGTRPHTRHQGTWVCDSCGHAWSQS